VKLRINLRLSLLEHRYNDVTVGGGKEPSQVLEQHRLDALRSVGGPGEVGE